MGSIFTADQLKSLHQEAAVESLISIRPGDPVKRPFWNTHARQFIYAPSFNFETVEGAAAYRFTVTSSVDNKGYILVADIPWASLAPVWHQLPVGEATLKVEAIDAAGRVTGQSKLADPPCLYQDFDKSGYPKLRRFYRAAVFRGGYHDVSTSYHQSAVKALKHLFGEKHFQNWATDGEPDPNYTLYCYPSKTVAAVVDSMVMYSKSPRGWLAPLDPADSAKALQIAQIAADYLIRKSLPAGVPLEYLPPTYQGTQHTAAKYSCQLMMICPPSVGDTYLNLYEATKKDKYLQAAKHIADTYVKLQLPCGTWPLKVDVETGKSITDNLCVPTTMVDLFDRLADTYGLKQYDKPGKLALQWIMANPVSTYNWEGQFEDVEPSSPHQNLSGNQVCSMALYLLDHCEDNPQYLLIAEELLRFVEDQFVIWEKPFPTRDKDAMGQKAHSKDWVTPCVLEQYGYYVPIDFSAAGMIAACSKAYEVTGKKLYLAKACELADAMIVAQDAKTGLYRTYWWKKDGPWEEGYWLNCAAYDIKVMLDFAQIIDKNM
jgi:maltose/maltodextrin transport system substrate-binding protein